MIVGGFNGKFLSDYYIITCDEESGMGKRIQKYDNTFNHQSLTLFPF